MPCAAGVSQWQRGSFPSLRRGFDSLHPLQILSAAATWRVSGGDRPLRAVRSPEEVDTGLPNGARDAAHLASCSAGHAKEQEWQEYIAQVHDWEIERYLASY